MFPKGNPKGDVGHSALAVYLNVPDSDTPPGWQRRAKFVLILQNQIDSSQDLQRGVLFHSQLLQEKVCPPSYCKLYY